MTAAEQATDVLTAAAVVAAVAFTAWELIRCPRTTQEPAVTQQAPNFDSTRAIKEGWMINERSDAPPYAIETLDDPEAFGVTTSFASDQHAYVHVVTQARAGSAYHQGALDFLAAHAPEAHRWAVDTYEYNLGGGA